MSLVSLPASVYSNFIIFYLVVPGTQLLKKVLPKRAYQISVLPSFLTIRTLSLFRMAKCQPKSPHLSASCSMKG